MAELGNWQFDNSTIGTRHVPYPYLVPSINEQHPSTRISSPHGTGDGHSWKDTLLRIIVIDDDLKSPPYHIPPQRIIDCGHYRTLGCNDSQSPITLSL